MNCPICGSEMKVEIGNIGIPFLRCVQFQAHIEPYPEVKAE